MGGGEPTHPLSSQKVLNEAEEGWSHAGQSIHLQLPGWFQQPAPRQATGEAEPGQEHQGEAPQRCQQLGRRPHAGHGAAHVLTVHLKASLLGLVERCATLAPNSQ